jgi:major membrane immunogen (membrane-anchored lipoprotein)
MLAGSSFNQVSSQTQKTGTYQKHDTTKMNKGKKGMMKDTAHHKKMMKDSTKWNKSEKGMKKK